MNRSSIYCKHCGQSDFEVTVNYCIPRAITLECKCGYLTPIAFFDKNNNTYGINDESTNDLYEESFCRDIEIKEAREANLNYWRKKERRIS